MTSTNTHLDTGVVDHPVLVCAADIQAALKSVADVNPVFMDTDQKASALVELTRLSTQLESLRLRVIATAGDVAETDGAPNVASWLKPPHGVFPEREPPRGESRRLPGDDLDPGRRSPRGRDGVVGAGEGHRPGPGSGRDR